jgi:hypothetical protein
MSCRTLLAPVVFCAVIALSAGTAHWGESLLWAAQPKKKPSGGLDASGAKKAKRTAAAGEKAAPRKKGEPRRAPRLRSGTEAILKVLREPTSLEFIERPLLDVAAEVQDMHGVQVHVDQRALDDVGIPSDTPITFALASIPLRSALELMLDQLDLTWAIRSDVLLITTPEMEENMLVTKTYDVSDLLVSPRNHRYQGGTLPTTPHKNYWPGMYAPGDLMSDGGGATGGAAGTTDGMGLMCGGAHWSSLDRQYGGTDDLIDLITTVIAPDTWDDVGGPGSCVVYDRVLVVSQTIAIHLEMEAFLDTLRAQRQAVPTVVLDARWLLLDSDLLDQLLGDRKPRNADTAPVAVDPRALDLLTRTVPSYRARITCVSGHKAYLAAGDRRSVVHGAIPVVGSGIGYQPVMRVPNVGLVLEICPTIELGRKMALLDLQSTVTRWRKPDRALRVGTHWPPSQSEDFFTGETVEEPGGASSVDVDRVNLPAQQFAATMRVPLGKPVLVGGLTLSPTTDADDRQVDEERKQLYLIVHTSRVADQR